MSEAARAAELLRLERLIQALPTGFSWAPSRFGFRQAGPWVTYGLR